jgi:hypothetical protein
MRDACTVLLVTSGENRPLARPTHNGQDNIKMGLICENVEWIQLVQDTGQW